MRTTFAVGAVLAATVSTVAANACAPGTAHVLGGNWYCSAVKAITYTNFGSSGTYNEVVSMDGGACSSRPKGYSGSLAPLNEEVSWHFRGPVSLKQFAFYSPGSGAPPEGRYKREMKPSIHERRHQGHQHLHKRANEKRAVGDMVTATINGQVVSWVNQYAGGAAPAAPTQAPASPPAGGNKYPTKKPAPVVNPGAGNWGRQGYYNAEAGVADGLTFLNHRGGDGSGVFDYDLGNSLSYASEDGCTGSDSPKVLSNKMIPDNEEIVIMTDKPCNGDCGTVRPGTVAYHGFDGDNKIFLAEFDMPVTGKTGWNEDMPAAWILNAAIPRTLQYGKAECSCWKTGCGEFDVFEILDAGNMRAKSTLHGNISGGDSHFFERPSGKTVKLAVVFNAAGSSVHIKILDDSFEFKPTLDGEEVEAMLQEEVAAASTFVLS
ncbi:uncharacterized protein BDCG_04000 [Blastomyces dermatitidis ER-3]|uniref:glucan endo-1,3-beta-D-glucosidase n=2 Tax=Ajellomyces dermatitidis TaxID=5039 RepID=F2TES5_AJEDA|nr:uncharacterized protein BDCG_04000 [Blastomyces dermatitidis ER-3]EEQ88880.2 hypothetical protein BDCG_04000 [Blastomyces dermatitidis ER-3]EGE81710.1 TOS1 [Blastomyces dermatitidis ATCC 18188]